MNFTGNIVSILPLINGIRKMSSTDSSLLPQRSGETLDSYYQIRQHNRKLYEKLKDDFIDNHLFSEHNDVPGIYFFVQMVNEPRYYYIGISGTKSKQSKTLKERLRKHLLTFDHAFYYIAYPEKFDEYYDNYIQFYASGKYNYMKKTYDRQFSALKEVKFDHIAWIGSKIYDYKNWDPIETHFIVEYQPPANASKRNSTPDSNYLEYFKEVKCFLYNELFNIPRHVDNVNDTDYQIGNGVGEIKEKGYYNSENDSSIISVVKPNNKQGKLLLGLISFAREYANETGKYYFDFAKYSDYFGAYNLSKGKINTAGKFIFGFEKRRGELRIVFSDSVPEEKGLSQPWLTKPQVKRVYLVIDDNPSEIIRVYLEKIIKRSIDLGY